jgi:hypothetical protein
MERVMRKRMLRISQLAPVAFAAAALLLAAPSHAQRRCSQNPEVTGRSCPEAVCIALQDIVDLKCKSGVKACRNVFGCAIRQTSLQGWEACLEARENIHNTCWIGVVDIRHQAEVARVKDEIADCHTQIARPISEGGCGPDPCP